MADEQRKRVQSADGIEKTTRRARAAAAKGMSFRALADLYRAEVSTFKKAPEHDARHLRQATDHFGDRPVSEITADEWMDFFRSKLKVTVAQDGRKHGGNTAAKRLQSCICAVLNWGVTEKKVLDLNPIGRAKRVGRPEQSRDRVLNDEELTRLLVVLDDDSANSVDASIRLALRLILETCCRPEEVAEMQVAELVNLDGRSPEWHRPREGLKNDQAHIVPLSPQAVETIKAAIKISAPSEYVFASPRTNAAVRRASLGKAMKRTLVPQAKIARTTPHDLRRTSASIAARFGATVAVLGMLVGHKPKETLPGVLSVYVRYSYLTERRSALEKIGEHLAGLLALA